MYFKIGFQFNFVISLNWVLFDISSYTGIADIIDLTGALSLRDRHYVGMLGQ